MKYWKKGMAVCLMAVLALGIAFTPKEAEAAKKKLTVNRVYEGAKKIKGKTKKKYTVKVKIGKKTYTKKANKKGNFTLKVPKLAAGKSYTVKSYKGKRLYTKKKVYVIAKKVKINTFKPTSKTITGYTRPGYKVKLTINGKTYTVKANKTSGKFTVKLKKAAGSGKATVKVYNTKGKKFTTATKAHSHQWKQQYKTVKHEEAGHYETVTVPAWDETKQVAHDICLVDGTDLTKNYFDSVKNKTYPICSDKVKDNWGYTEENGWPRTEDEIASFAEEGVKIDKYAPPYAMYMSEGGWDGHCDGHNYTCRYVPVIIAHHDATTKQQWVVDKKAYTEKVPNGYQCACGATKK